MQAYGAAILKHHAELLAASAIAPEVAIAAGIRSASRPSELPPEFAWLKDRGGLPALIFPWHRIDGESVNQLRPDKPVDFGEGDTRKYLWPKDAGSVLAVHPAMLGRVLDPAVPLVWVEGTKQYLAAVSALAAEEFAVVGIAGCYGWMHEGKPVPDLDKIPWDGRLAYTAFDADVETKRGVWEAAALLDEGLRVRGARSVGYVKVPGAGSAGLDDVLGGIPDKTSAMVMMIERARSKLPRRPARKLTHSAPLDPPRTLEHLNTSLSPAETQAPSVQVCNEECEKPPALASETDILAKLEEIVSLLGVTGESRIVRAAYLTVVSQVLEEPVSLVVKGESAGGKSYSTRKVLVLVPEEETYSITAGSQRSLIYTEEEFVHRSIVMFEATALREAAEQRDGDMTAMLVRTLLSEGRIRYPVTEKGDDGKFTVRMIEKKGPTNLIVTTTADNLHHENETRLLSLVIDESPEQTRWVLKKIAERRNQAVPAEPPDVRPWHQLFHWIKYHGEHRAYIPYAGYLSDNVSAAVVRMRRDFSTLLGHIEAHAVLHQASRERDGFDRIIATAADYEAARDLLAEAFAVSSGKRVPESVRKVVAAVAELLAEDIAVRGKDDPAPEIVTARVAKRIERSRPTTTKGLKSAVDSGYLVNRETGTGRGHPARYVLGNEAMPADTPAIPGSIPPEACTLEQILPASPQVSPKCSSVQVFAGGKGDAGTHSDSSPSGDLGAPVIESLPDDSYWPDEPGEDDPESGAEPPASPETSPNGHHPDGDDLVLVAQDGDEGEWRA